MKHQIFYLLGAGASVMQDKYSKKTSLPLANDFKDKIEKLFYEEKTPVEYVQTKSCYFTQKVLLGDISLDKKIIEFQQEISKFGTIDEAMRYYYLNENIERFEYFKGMISSIFYLFENIAQFRDPRYKQFLMTLIEGKGFNLPENIKFLSWNYDNQFEHACYEIQDDKVNFKNIINPDNFIQINGRATYKHSDINEIHNIDHNNMPEILSERFDEFKATKNEIDFAWEEEFKPKFEKRIEAIRNFINPDTQRILLVIGYSFPYINHQFDLEIIKAISPDKIYIQNPNIENEENYINSFRKRMAYEEIYMGNSIEIIKDCSRFHIPNEYFNEYYKPRSISFI